jgi:hypothetical protein
MSIKLKLKAAVNKAYSLKGGPGDKVKGKKEKVQEIPEVNAGGKVYEGPLARFKAKQSIKKGTTDVSYAKKKGLGGREKLIKYGDVGSNKAGFMKKTVTTSAERFNRKMNRSRDTE